MTNEDPFAGADKAPSLTFKGSPVGTVQTLAVSDYAKLVQSIDLDTDQPAVWPDGNPKMCAVINGTNEQGEPRSIWASKPSSLFSAIADAQTAVEKGYRVKPGDTIAIKFVSEDPPAKKAWSPKRNFAAKITVGVAPPPAASEDPWATSDSPATSEEPPW